MHWYGVPSAARFLSRTGDIYPGARRVVPVAQPAAGSNWQVVVPGGVMWNIRAGVATFTADATVANRLPGLLVTVNGQQVWNIADNTPVLASTSVTMNFASGFQAIQSGAGGTRLLLPLPDVNLPSGAVVQSQAAGEDTGDQWTGVNLYIEEYYFTDEQLTEIEAGREQAEREAYAMLESVSTQLGLGA